MPLTCPRILIAVGASPGCPPLLPTTSPASNASSAAGVSRYRPSSAHIGRAPPRTLARVPKC
eukprot:4420985-Pleurochrysis_carterae.AAC.2